MGRPHRIDEPGRVWHITTRGDNREPIYRDDHDRRIFLALLARSARRYLWVCYAHCLMTNHYHLVLETPYACLSDGMRDLNGGFARTVNVRHKRVGHAFERRFATKPVESERQLAETSRYVVLNPVRAGICARAGDWEWSSYRASAALAAAPSFLAADRVPRLVAGTGDPAAAYRAFVAEREVQ